MLVNALYGILGKNTFTSYHYHPFMLAVNHLAILQTYYLYRQFLRENILTIRSDCIHIKGELPEKILTEQHKYHIQQYNKVSFLDQNNIFIHDTNELKSFISNKVEREELIEKLKISQ